MRLTRYDDENRYYRPCDYESDKQSTILKLCKKLGQLEDIEDRLGIDLLVYSKMALGTTVYSNKYGFGGQELQQYIYSFWYKAFCIKGYKGELIPVYYVKDYGKTWALTKEELL